MSGEVSGVARDGADRLFVALSYLQTDRVMFTTSLTTQQGALGPFFDLGGIPTLPTRRWGVHCLVTGATRLFLAATSPPSILIWEQANIGPGAMPDVIIPLASAPRGIAVANDVLAVGSDVTTLVFPDAHLLGPLSKPIVLVGGSTDVRFGRKSGLLYAYDGWNYGDLRIWANVTVNPQLRLLMDVTGQSYAPYDIDFDVYEP